MLQQMHHELYNFILLFPLKRLYLSINLCFLWITPLSGLGKVLGHILVMLMLQRWHVDLGGQLGTRYLSSFVHLLCMFEHHIFLVSVSFEIVFCDIRGW